MCPSLRRPLTIRGRGYKPSSPSVENTNTAFGIGPPPTPKEDKTTPETIAARAHTIPLQTNQDVTVTNEKT